MVQLQEGYRLWTILEFLRIKPRTTKEIVEMLGLRKGRDRNGSQYYSSWPTTRNRLRGLGASVDIYGRYDVELITYNRHTRKYSITAEGRRAIQQ
jgi:hypothetical protein